jgi:hypothetical protein
MTIETINLLKELVAEKSARLAAIERRLDVLQKAVKEPLDLDEIHLIGEEVASLGIEINELIVSRKRLQKEINSFFKPAA